jgi:hypothetical protein
MSLTESDAGYFYGRITDYAAKRPLLALAKDDRLATPAQQ